MRISQGERLWRRVEKTATCWQWTGPTVGAGYGHIWFDGKVRPAHVASWTLAHGPIAAGLCVLHRCDNPRCVRPDHLFLGTRQDNVFDMIAKGRGHWQTMTTCKRGHQFSGDNVMQISGAAPQRRCRACDREKRRQAQQRRRDSRKQLQGVSP